MNLPPESEPPNSGEVTRLDPIGHRSDANRDEPDARSILGMMAKFWVPGEVKTRLGGSIGMTPAATLHRLFTTRLCENLCRSAARRELCISPDWRLAEVESMLAASNLDRHWRAVAQGEGDLGQRMARWMCRNLTLPDSRSILIGADCPTLGDHDIRQAIDLLDRHDVVLGPALDGGYYLIGLRGCWDDRLGSLFQCISWSGPDVFERTAERAAQARLSLGRLPVAEDIDTVVELNQLNDHLRKSASPADRDLLAKIERALESSPADPPSQAKR